MGSHINDDIIENILGDDVNPLILNVDNFGNAIDIKKKIFNLLHINIRSIRKNFDNLVTFLNTYNCCHYCDIIVLSECWTIDNTNFNIPGYIGYHNSANYNKNDGVFIYTREGLGQTISDFKLDTSNITMTRITFICNNLTYAINALYRPPSSNTNFFIKDLNNYLTNNLKAQIEILVGDININLKDNSLSTCRR